MAVSLSARLIQSAAAPAGIPSFFFLSPHRRAPAPPAAKGKPRCAVRHSAQQRRRLHLRNSTNSRWGRCDMRRCQRFAHSRSPTAAPCLLGWAAGSPAGFQTARCPCSWPGQRRMLRAGPPLHRPKPAGPLAVQWRQAAQPGAPFLLLTFFAAPGGPCGAPYCGNNPKS